MMHNERLSDPDDEYTQQIKEITNKGSNQTEQDKALVSKLEWFGGIYTNGSKQLVMPAANIIRCFRATASYTKEGKKLAGGLSPTALYFPFLHDGEDSLEKLFADRSHVDRRQVKVGRGRVKRTRPIFPQWQIPSEFELFEDILDLSRLQRIAEDAGRSQGLCDARILGYGRFKIECKRIK